jgi:hypothetical protein
MTTTVVVEGLKRASAEMADDEEDELLGWDQEHQKKQPVEEVIQNPKSPKSMKGQSPYEQDMNYYLNWHKSHPLTSTPRKLRSSTVASQLYVCEEYPNLAYIETQAKGYYKKTSLSKEYQSSMTGKNATFKEVTKLAHDLEHSYRLEKKEGYLDPWWNHSVKVQTNIFHTKENNFKESSSSSENERFE